MNVLIIVDMLNDFVHPDGALYLPGSELLVPKIAGIIPIYDRIIFACDQHDEDDQELSIYPPHAMHGTWGAQIVCGLRGISLQKNVLVLPKNTHDGYSNPAMHDYTKDVDSIEIVGVAFDICVSITALSAVKRARTRVLAHLTAPLKPNMVEAVTRELIASGVFVTGESEIYGFGQERDQH